MTKVQGSWRRPVADQVSYPYGLFVRLLKTLGRNASEDANKRLRYGHTPELRGFVERQPGNTPMTLQCSYDSPMYGFLRPVTFPSSAFKGKCLSLTACQSVFVVLGRYQWLTVRTDCDMRGLQIRQPYLR